MSLIKRISEHPWLSLTVSAATIVSTVLAVAASLVPKISSGDRSAPTSQTAAQSDLVGTWALQSPPGFDWTVDYRANGSFTLTTRAAPGSGQSAQTVDGFYEAENGVFTTRAPETSADDHGTYRLLTETTLEMTGQLGVSVWIRVE